MQEYLIVARNNTHFLCDAIVERPFPDLFHMQVRVIVWRNGLLTPLKVKTSEILKVADNVPIKRFGNLYLIKRGDLY